MIDQLKLWMDDEPRDGPANMAVDEWLLDSVEGPLLRIYRWQPGWGSYGYFVPDAEAAESLAGLERVRRWTGGGIVNHCKDWTYTVVLPRGEPLAELRGGESYRVIHRALAAALTEEGIECELAVGVSASPGGVCFQKPAEFDLLDSGGRKIAGAGQRRTVNGLLHQGSLAAGGNEGLAERFSRRLAGEVEMIGFSPDAEMIESLVRSRYATKAWASRR